MAKKKQTYPHNKPILIVIAILLLLIIFPIILSYSNFYPPFIDKKVIYFLDSVVVDIPFLPKTPKQVFTKSLFCNQNLQNYHLTSKLDLDSGKVKLLEFTAIQAVEKPDRLKQRQEPKLSEILILFQVVRQNLKRLNLRTNFISKLPVCHKQLE